MSNCAETLDASVFVLSSAVQNRAMSWAAAALTSQCPLLAGIRSLPLISASWAAWTMKCDGLNELSRNSEGSSVVARGPQYQSKNYHAHLPPRATLWHAEEAADTRRRRVNRNNPYELPHPLCTSSINHPPPPPVCSVTKLPRQQADAVLSVIWASRQLAVAEEQRRLERRAVALKEQFSQK